MIASTYHSDSNCCNCTTKTTSTTNIADTNCITICQCGCCATGYVECDIPPEPIPVYDTPIKHIVPFSGLRKPFYKKIDIPKHLNKHRRIKRSSAKG